MTGYLRSMVVMTLLGCLVSVPVALAAAVGVLLYRFLTNG